MVKRIFIFGAAWVLVVAGTILAALNPSILPEKARTVFNSANAFEIAVQAGLFMLLFAAPVLLFGMDPRKTRMAVFFYVVGTIAVGPFCLLMWAASVSDTGYVKACGIAAYQIELLLCITLSSAIIFEYRWIERLYFGTIGLVSAGFPLLYYASLEFGRTEIKWLVLSSPFYMVRTMIKAPFSNWLTIGSFALATAYIIFKTAFLAFSRFRNSQDAVEALI